MSIEIRRRSGDQSLDEYGLEQQRGAVLPLIAMALAMLLMVAALLIGVSQRAGLRAQAQSGADAAALAGVVEGVAGAERVASANGVRLIDFRSEGDTVWVAVERDGVRAEARAEYRLGPVEQGAQVCCARRHTLGVVWHRTT